MKYPEGFTTIFPIAALAFARSIVRIVLEEQKTGLHVTHRLDAQRQTRYFSDLDIAKKLTNPAIDKYHHSIIDEICVDIARRGR